MTASGRRRARLASRALVVAAAFAAFGATPGPPGGWSGPAPDPAADPNGDRPGASALSADLLDSIASIESRLETLRALPFKSKVKTSALSREGVRAYMEEILHREYPPAEIAAEEETYRYFGFVGPEDHLEPILLDLLESQVAGAYDPERKTLYVVPGPITGTLALAHELAHALMDQHFDIQAMMDGAKEDDDRALALSCLVEGEATMVMALWSVQAGFDPNASPLLGGDPSEAIEAAQAGMNGVPAFVRDSLVFPYLGGATWASEIMTRGGGLKALDAYFREPPDSTEQILHPERSLPPRDVPSVIDSALVSAALPEGPPAVKRGAMGEFAIRHLLGHPANTSAAAAAEGWDGDQYVLAGRRGGRTLTWVSVWDTENDAAEFRDAAGAWLAARAGACRPGIGPAYGAERRGRVVIVTEGGEASGSGSPAGRASAVSSRLPSGIEFR